MLAGLALLATASLPRACQCSQSPPPFDLDGNVIVGDGASPNPGMDVPTSTVPTGDASRVDAAGPGLDGGEPLEGGTLPDASPAPDAGCDALATVVLTATGAVARAGALGGVVVDVLGTSTVAASACVHHECVDAGLCCDVCTATLAIDRAVTLAGSACFSPPPGCAGNQCEQVCRPPVLGIRQRFRGLLVRSDGGVTLRLIAVDP